MQLAAVCCIISKLACMWLKGAQTRNAALRRCQHTVQGSLVTFEGRVSSRTARAVHAKRKWCNYHLRQSLHKRLLPCVRVVEAQFRRHGFLLTPSLSCSLYLCISPSLSLSLSISLSLFIHSLPFSFILSQTYHPSLQGYSTDASLKSREGARARHKDIRLCDLHMCNLQIICAIASQMQSSNDMGNMRCKINQDIQYAISKTQ